MKKNLITQTVGRSKAMKHRTPNIGSTDHLAHSPLSPFLHTQFSLAWGCIALCRIISAQDKPSARFSRISSGGLQLVAACCGYWDFFWFWKDAPMLKPEIRTQSEPCAKRIPRLDDCGHMSTIVKICGITSPADALAAVEAGADALGLMFYEPSPRNISLKIAAEIARQLPPFIVKVGVFVNAEEETISRAIGECGLNIAQFHGEETPEFCGSFPVMTIKAFRIRDAGSLKDLAEYRTDAWLLDAYAADKLGGTGTKFNWDLAIEAKKLGKPIFLAGGLTPENVAEAVRKVQPYAVDVSSGVESAPGKKDQAKMREFVKAAKS